MFIGREKELKFLSDKYNEDKAQLIVLYGRRRVGKTETLKKFSESLPHVFFSCRECTDKLQLKNFSDKLLSQRLPQSQYLTEFQTWEAAFRAILDLPYGNAKKLVIIDEFPYMCSSNPGIPSLLQTLWDELFKTENVMIILCGSSMSFIENDLLAEKNALYGRATGIYKMQAMDFYDAAKFFPSYSPEDKILAYSVLGGMPHYLSQFNPNITFSDNIKQNILTKGCVLYSEVEFMLHQELRETQTYNSIIQAVALGNTKLNDISQKSLINDKPKTSTYLKHLTELGIIEKEFSVLSPTKEAANSNRGLYRISDNFFRFWYTFAFTNLSSLETDDVDGVYTYAIEPALNHFASYTFEDICRTFISKLQIQGSLPFRYTKIGRYFGKSLTPAPGGKSSGETEIDLLAFSADHRTFIAGECKYKDTPFPYSDYQSLVTKCTGLNAKPYYALFSKSGFSPALISESRHNDSLLLFTLDDICRGA